VSQANVEIFRAFNEAFSRGDWDAVAANIDPHILIRTDPVWPEQRIYGRDAAMAFYRGAWESWGPDNCVVEIVDLGDRLLARNCWTIRGLHSGVVGEQSFSSISTYREGRVVFVEFFLEHEQARNALGLKG